MQTAEASQRGLLLTGNKIYLAPYQAAKIQARRHLSLSWPDQVTAFYGLPFPLAAQSESCEQKMLVDVATEPPVLPALEGWTVSERIDALDRKPTFRFVHIGKALA